MEQPPQGVENLEEVSFVLNAVGSKSEPLLK